MTKRRKRSASYLTYVISSTSHYDQCAISRHDQHAISHYDQHTSFYYDQRATSHYDQCAISHHDQRPISSCAHCNRTFNSVDVLSSRVRSETIKAASSGIVCLYQSSVEYSLVSSSLAFLDAPPIFFVPDVNCEI